MEANMDQEPELYTHNAFWLEDRVTLTYEVSPTPNGNFPDNNLIVTSMNRWVGRLNEAIKEIGFSLSSINEEQEKPSSAVQTRVSQQSSSLAAQAENDLPPGVYVFLPPIHPEGTSPGLVKP